MTLAIGDLDFFFFFGRQVDLMFQQIAAQILGLTLTRIQMEDQHKVVKADIVKYKENKPIPTKPKKSSICTLQ